MQVSYLDGGNSYNNIETVNALIIIVPIWTVTSVNTGGVARNKSITYSAGGGAGIGSGGGSNANGGTGICSINGGGIYVGSIANNINNCECTNNNVNNQNSNIGGAGGGVPGKL